MNKIERSFENDAWGLMTDDEKLGISWLERQGLNQKQSLDYAKFKKAKSSVRITKEEFQSRGFDKLLKVNESKFVSVSSMSLLSQEQKNQLTQHNLNFSWGLNRYTLVGNYLSARDKATFRCELFKSEFQTPVYNILRGVGVTQSYLKKATYLPFPEARDLAQDFCSTNGVNSRPEFKKAYKEGLLPAGLTGYPERVYEGEFQGWGDFLGTGNKKGSQIFRSNLTCSLEFLTEQLELNRQGRLSHSQMCAFLSNEQFVEAYSSLSRNRDNLPSYNQLLTDKGEVERAAQQLAELATETLAKDTKDTQGIQSAVDSFNDVVEKFELLKEDGTLDSTTYDQEYKGDALDTIVELDDLYSSRKLDEQQVKNAGEIATQELLNQLHNGDTTIEIIKDVDTNGKPIATYAISKVLGYMEDSQRIFDKLSTKINIPFEPTTFQRVVPLRVAQEKKHLAIAPAGSGKTFASIVTLASLEAPLTVILCPASVIPSWEKALNSHYPTAKVIYDLLSDLQVIEEGNTAILLHSYEGLASGKNAMGKVDKILSCLPELLILDESHRCKNGKANTTKIVAELSKGVKHTLMLTATVITRTLNDLKSQVAILKGEELPKSTTSNLVRLNGNKLGNLVQEAFALHRSLFFDASNWVEVKEPVKVNYHPDIEIDISDRVEEYSRIELFSDQEVYLTQFKLDKAIELCEDGTIIFCRNLEPFPQIRLALIAQGFDVYQFNSKVKNRHSELQVFINSKGNGRKSVLIAAKNFGTGINGSQFRSNKMVCISNNYTYS